MKPYFLNLQNTVERNRWFQKIDLYNIFLTFFFLYSIYLKKVLLYIYQDLSFKGIVTFPEAVFVVLYHKGIHYIHSGIGEPILQILKYIFHFKPSSNHICFQGNIYVITVNPMQVMILGTSKIISFFEERLSLIHLCQICLSVIKTSTTVTRLLINNKLALTKTFSLQVIFFPSTEL